MDGVGCHCSVIAGDVGIDLGIPHAPATVRWARNEVFHPAAGEIELWPDHRVARWTSSGLHRVDWRQGTTLGARVRFKRSQTTRWHAGRDGTFLVARQPLHRLLR